MKIPRLLKLVTFEDSRKAGFGIWLFIVATWLILKSPTPRIDAQTWLLCVVFSSSLLGLGTIADKYLDKMPNAKLPA